MLKHGVTFLLLSLIFLAEATDETFHNSHAKKSRPQDLLKPEVWEYKLERKHQISMADSQWTDDNLDGEWKDGIVSDENPEAQWVDFDPETLKEARQRSGRAKRQLIIPGTNWCGVGNVSKDNQATGNLASVDKCCKEHDHCPYTITGFTSKYNLYNFRFHTISHCECDDIFRTCLKMSSHQQAHVVGDLFFNMIGMKCFVFRRDQVCAERSWWGRCERHKYEWSAEIRDPIQY